MIAYRPEIDGLRAFAVVPVVLFHAGFSAFGGGFVGVDVFFVISGYLISSIILSDATHGSFSYANFYERRARRILPALFLVVLICLPFVWLIYLPEDVKDFSESVVSIPLFLANFVFESQSGYFERAADTKPLIHTWSLAVEEQFYLFFPILLLLLIRCGKMWMLASMLVLSALSLALAEWGIRVSPTDAYFLLPTRIWELLLGALIAVYLFYQKDKIYSDVASTLGLMMIAWSVFAFDSNTPFPGFNALLPTVGAMLVIAFTGPRSLAYRLLSNRATVSLGLISYSLYLWHQPIFAIVRYQSLGDPTVIIRLAMISTAIVLAVLSWKFIEQPFREASRISRKTLVQLAIGFSVFFVILGVIGIVKDGDLHRFDDEVLALSNPKGGAGCPAPQNLDGMCIIGAISQVPTIMIMGDSHAAVLTKSLGTELKKSGKAAFLVGTGSCSPLLNVSIVGDKSKKCQSKRDSVIDQALGDQHIETLILHAEWANYTTGTRWGRRSLNFFSDEDSATSSVDENQRVFERGIQRTISRLSEAGKTVIIVKSVPEYEVNVPNFLAKQLSKTGELDSKLHLVSETDYSQRNKGVETAFDQLEPTSDLKFVNPFSLFCPDGKCQLFDSKQQPLYTDSNHLSLAGADILASRIMTSLK